MARENCMITIIKKKKIEQPTPNQFSFTVPVTKVKIVKTMSNIEDLSEKTISRVFFLTTIYMPVKGINTIDK